MEAGSFPLGGFKGKPWEHEIKVAPEAFAELKSNLRRFEICQNDRVFQVGDCLIFRESLGEDPTGNNIYSRIDFISDQHQQPGFVVMGLGLWLVFRKRA